MYHSTVVSEHSSPFQDRFHATEGKQPQKIRLTNREKEFLQWSEVGKSSWEIAMIVDCSEANVNYHFNNIRRKFGVSSRHLAGKIAREQGLI
ncbi:MULTISPECIES: helix-turn-helix transcriptional regulator [Pseudomonas]|uniref:helix-turn-helix transcriptional regulator n=1 Tax=Pseudomonas TaxID=286 RepID=UPI001BEB78F1|nr:MULTISPECIES: LuxR family transcriptional regulator [Pseudomonas]MBT2341797.1 LuxR family transcriptional regulator [Pseudomonas fluorescens]